MSRYIAALVYRKKLGSIARKSIMAYCAERANDDGSGVWASKVRIAKEVECSKHTVIDTMRAFVSDGLMIEVGQRRTTNGYVVEYALNIARISALPDALTDDELTGAILDRSTEFTPRGATETPQEVQLRHPNRPLTVLKPSNIVDDDLFSAKDLPTKKTADEAFERFWKAYPPGRKTDKPKARQVWDQIVAGRRKGIQKTDAEAIISGAERYAATNPDPQYVPMPTTWLNGARWEDVPAVPPPTHHGGHRLRQNWGEVLR